MRRTNYPRDAEIIAALLDRAAEFQRITGMPFSAIGKHAVNDTACLSQVVKGRNLTLRSYQRLMDWLDDNWPQSLYERQRQKSTRRARRINSA